MRVNRITGFDPADVLTTERAIDAFLADAHQSCRDPAYLEHAHKVAAIARRRCALRQMSRPHGIVPPNFWSFLIAAAATLAVVLIFAVLTGGR